MLISVSLRLNHKMKSKYYRLSIFFAVVIITGLLLYRTAIVQVISAVLHRQGSSHGVFVPFISLYFLWFKLDDLKKIECHYNYYGIILLLPGIILSIPKIGTFHVQFLGFIVFIAGLIFLIFGKKCFKHMAFPTFFLITMIPIPKDIYMAIANYCRHIATSGSLKVISLFGISYFRDGWLVQLPNALLNINIGCSGIRYLVSYFVFGLAYAYLFRNTTKARVLIVALTVPISHLASILRLAVIFILTYTIGPKMAEYWPHVITSWIVFFVILMGSISIDQYFLKRKYAGRLGSEEAERLKSGEARTIGG